MSFISKNAFGLDISDVSIEALEIKRSLNKMTISSYGRVELEPGIVDNGRILNKEKLVEAIRILLSSTHPRQLKNRNVILSIPESKTFIHVFRLPAVISEANIGESVQYAAEETIPLSFDQVYHDYRIITQEADYQDVFYIACFKGIVDDYQEVLDRAGLNPVAFEAESSALARALTMDDMFEGVLIMDLGARTTIITIYDHQGIRYSENIPIAGNNFTEKIAKTLKVSSDKAEEIKRTVGMIGQGKQDKKSFSLEPLVQGIINEVNKAIDYHQKKTGFIINKVVLCGGTSLMPGLMDHLQMKLKVRVEPGNPLVGLHYNQKKVSIEQPIFFSTVVGLALRGIGDDPAHSDINLLKSEKEHKKAVVHKEPRRKRRKEEALTIKKPKNKRQIVLASVFAFLIAVFAGLYFWQKDMTEPLISWQSTDYLDQPITNQVVSSTINLQAEFSVYTQDQENLPSGSLTGRIIEKKITKTKEFAASGKKSVDQAATGRVTIINDYSANQPLIATTRFLTPAGVLFRLKQGVTVPAKSSVEADIYADEAGQSGEVEPATLTIPGLSSSLQQYIYGELKEPTTGGVKEVSYVMETDIEEAKKEVDSESQTVAVSEFEDELAATEVLFSQALSVEAQAPVYSASIGQDVETFSATWEVSAKALVLTEDDIKQKLTGQLSGKIPSDKSTDNYQIADWQYSLVEFDEQSGLVKIIITSQAQLL